VGTDKRERQKAGRQAKILEETAAAKRQRTFRTARNFGIAAVVILGAAFAYSTLTGDDGDKDSVSASEETTTTTAVEYSNPELAATVLERDPPDPAAPPADTAADALVVTTLIEGEGDPGTAQDGYIVHYVGKKPDNTVLDESWSTGSPFPIAGPLGEASLIDGWKEGLVGAKVGERRHLVIGSDKAYQDGVPLSFDVDIIDITRAG
jgi:FKBP-type peptidyl-prolyl cis-trans isomerase